MTTSIIHDIGYRHYEGRRLGRGYVLRSLYVHNLRAAFGLGRRDHRAMRLGGGRASDPDQAAAPIQQYAVQAGGAHRPRHRRAGGRAHGNAPHRIAELGAQLAAIGSRRTASGVVPVFR